LPYSLFYVILFVIILAQGLILKVFSGIIEKIIFTNADNGFSVFIINTGVKKVTVKGQEPNLTEGDFVECTGLFEKFRGSSTLSASKIMLRMPITHDGMISYLSSGKMPGIGKKTAEKLVKYLGLNLVQVVANDPNAVSCIPGIGQSKAVLINESLNNFLENEGASIFMEQFDLSKGQIAKIKVMYGNRVMKVLQENPYRIAIDISGIGFSIADKIALKLGFAQDDIRRLISGLGYILERMINKNGDTLILVDDWKKESLNLLFSNKRNEKKYVLNHPIDLLKKTNAISFLEIESLEYCSPKKLHLAEKGLSRDIKRIKEGSVSVVCNKESVKKCERFLDIELAEGQKKALVLAIENSFSIITGGPGTGKTTILKATIAVFKKEFGFIDDDILLCSPTGKAAKRMEDSCGITAKTIHRALMFNPETSKFEFNADNKLNYKLIIVDEFSMADCLIAYSLLQAVKNGARVLIVGDADQLPSVGPGNVLSDLIKSGYVAYHKLTEIFRQAKNSKIVTNSHRINKGQMPIIDHSIKDNDFWFIEKDNDSKILEEILSLLSRIPKYYGADQKEDIQILTPMRKGTVGQYSLNEHIQKIINPPKEHLLKVKQDDNEVSYSAGDKIIQIKNNNDLGVFNGTIGEVTSVFDKKNGLNLNFGDMSESYGLQNIDDIRLAYAMTIHKSQGSEYPFVFIPLTMSHSIMLNRNILYTAITRAKKQVILIGNKKALELCVNNVFNHNRKTGLVYFLKEFQLNEDIAC
jgi:exodeoxyribonuclease V alpha subunit